MCSGSTREFGTCDKAPNKTGRWRIRGALGNGYEERGTFERENTANGFQGFASTSHAPPTVWAISETFVRVNRKEKHDTGREGKGSLLPPGRKVGSGQVSTRSFGESKADFSSILRREGQSGGEGVEVQ